MYLELNLNEPAGSSLFASPKLPLDLLRVVEKAANDNKVKGIILNIGSLSGIGNSRDHLWELRNVLEKFKSGNGENKKKIIAYINYADMDVYCLASVADKIVMNELGTLNLTGYSVSMNYVQNTLEKLGIGVRELRYFEYKTASDMFTRNSISDADRRQYNDYLDDIFYYTRDKLKTARNWTDAEFDNILSYNYFHSAKSALENGLIDSIGRKDAVLEVLKNLEDAKIDSFAIYGEIESSLTREQRIYSPRKSGDLFKRSSRIALVYANGQTDMVSGMAILSLSNTIRELADSKRVKAIVVRINSPGGSADAADYFSEAVRYAKQKKPVVISMGQVAASGGYWAALNSSHIFATPYTITGSIGVIATWFYDNGLYEKAGLNTQTLKRGEHADLYTGFLIPYRDFTAQEEDQYKNYILDIYSVFTGKVAVGRNMDIDKVEAAAQGRIFSGLRAFDAGLIDSIGGLSDALNLARSLAGIPQDGKVRYDEYPKPKFYERMLNQFPFVSVLKRIFSGKNSSDTASMLAEIFIPYADLRYRLQKNGDVMPILPLR